MPPLSRSQKQSLLQDLLPFAVGWTLLVLSLIGFWWRAEHLAQRHLAQARVETAFRLQAANHMDLMELRGSRQRTEALQPGGLARTYRWQAMDHGDLTGRLTSLRPRAGAEPDGWERQALERLGPGPGHHYSEVVTQEGQPRLRFMGALRLEYACMGCHDDHATAAAGSLLGGLSLSVPVDSPWNVLKKPNNLMILGSLLLAWASVLATMGLARHRQHRAAAMEGLAAGSMRNSEERLRKTQHLANLGYFEQDHRSGRITWSEELFRIFGFPQEGVPPTYDLFMERVHPEDRVRVAENFQKHLSEHAPYQLEFRILLEDGELRHILVSSHTEFDPAGTPIRTLGINLDISARKQLDEALQTEAEAHRVLLETSLDGCLEVDAAGRILNVNDAYLVLSGHERAELLGTPARDLEATDDSGAVRSQTSRIRRKGMDRFETRHICKDGRRIPLQASVIYLPSKGRFLYFLRDLTGEREARQALALSEARFGEVFRLIPDSLFITDLATGRILEMNPSAASLTGWNRDEVIGRTAGDLGFWQEPSHRREMVAELLERGESTPRMTFFKLKDGSIRLGEVRAVRLGTGDPPLALTMVRDRTELKQRQTMAPEAEAMAAEGPLAAGVAHEINGPLAVITSSLELLQGAVPRDHPRRPYLELVRREVDRIAGIVRNL